MADPATPYSQRKSDPAGVGPFRFEIPALAAGEQHVLDLRETEKGKYVVQSPAGYDAIEVTNTNTSVPIEVLINESRPMHIPPNSVQSLERSGIYRLDVFNRHDTSATTADEVSIEIMKQSYGADERAQDMETRPKIRQVLSHFMGL